ncbi:MAG: dethiobiotin synthase [Chitinivibrionales bacterium]
MELDQLRGFFITGTDTGIGKTFTCRVLADALSKTLDVTYVKPVQTGCVRNELGELTAPDFDIMLKGPIQFTGSYHSHVPYQFEPACSPHLAAKLANREISLDHIAQCVRWVGIENGRAKLVLVEGAGGVLTPLSATTSMLDLIGRLGLPVVLVVSPKLGTLNHTLLSINAIRQRALPLAGVVMNNYCNAEEDFIYKDNVETIRNAIRPVPFLVIPFNGRANGAVEEFCHELTAGNI